MAEKKQISWGFKWQKLERQTQSFGTGALVPTHGGHRSLIASWGVLPEIQRQKFSNRNLFGADGILAISSVRHLVSSVPQAPPR